MLVACRYCIVLSVIYFLFVLSARTQNGSIEKGPVKLLQVPITNGKQKVAMPRNPSLDKLPRETFVPFRKQANLMLVDGYINGRNATMIFDTGASGCLFSMQHLKALGIQMPPDLPTIAVWGVGNREQTKAWTMLVDLKLGGIERRQFPVHINDSPINYPLLGMDFLNGMEYTINNDDKIIQFKRSLEDTNLISKVPMKNDRESLLRSILSLTYEAHAKVDSTCHYVYTLPFVELGQEIVVMVNINGKNCPMLLDTGTNICVFSSAQVRKLGTYPRRTGRMVTGKGAVGYITSPLYIFDSAQFVELKAP